MKYSLQQYSFQNYYYRHCPILDVNMSVDTLYHSCPFLFWTIIILSSRWNPSLSYLYNDLIEKYQLLLGKSLMAPLNIIEPIQAGILLCYWPLAVERQIYDPTWNYCGLITNAAIKLGIHMVGARRREKLSVLDSRIQAKTWMACCFINYRQDITS
jgi:hypothetical protein